MLMDTYLRNQNKLRPVVSISSGLMGSLISLVTQNYSLTFPKLNQPLEEYWSSPKNLKYEDEIVQFMMQHYQQNNIVDLGFSDEGSFATAVRYSATGTYPRTLDSIEQLSRQNYFSPGSASENSLPRNVIRQNAGFVRSLNWP